MDDTPNNISNFYSGDEGFFPYIEKVEQWLRANPSETVEHSAWEFSSTITFDGSKFTAKVQRYQSSVDTITCNTLKELVIKTNDTWGWG